VHGWTTFVKYSAADHHRCLQCRKDRVVARRRKVKALLVEEAGGRCLLCGYDRFTGALQFHHLDPNESRSASACAASPARWSAAAGRANACCCARTAMRRSKPASPRSHSTYYERGATVSG
jgi:hypothetical protein